MFSTGTLLLLCLLAAPVISVSFSSLYNRQLKSTYGFQILKHYHNEQFGNESVKHFEGESILFMTPWREEGINLSLKYLGKFDYFVPCYYDLTKKGETIQLDTSKHFSEDYLRKAKQANPKIKILPRVYVHGMQGDVFFLASTIDQQFDLMISYFEEILKNQLYDGVVFTSPFITPNHKYPFSMKSILNRIRAVTPAGKLLFITMDGVDNKPDQKISKKKARELIDIVDRVIVTNYDYPKGNSGITIPISPMDWIKENYDFYCEVYGRSKLEKKLIMAIPLYGYFVAMYGKYDPIEGKEFLAKLRDEKQAALTWNQQMQECMLYLNKMEYIYFPCLHFLNSRLRYFESIKAGVGAFEIGSGLEIFMQMF